MIDKNTICCPVCKKHKSSFFIVTNALMHKPNSERFVFNMCNNCETVFLTNPKSLNDLDDYYTESYLPYQGPAAWGKYRSFVVKSQNQLDLKRVNFVKKQLKNNSNSVSVLDVGCGNPTFLDALQHNSNINCFGIDFSDEGWSGKNYDKLQLKKIAIEDFETNASCDLITLWHYLEHDYNPSQTIEKLYNCLKPGGKLVIEVPDYKSISCKIQKSHWQGWHSPRHISLFSEKSFEALFSKEKWKIISHFRYGTLDAFTLWWLGKMEKRGIDWSSKMEKNFWGLVLHKVVTAPFFAFEKFFPLGIQMLVVEKK